MGCDAYTELAGPDCDDGDYVRQDEAPFYVDADHDGVGTGTAVIICVDALVEPFGYAPVGGDCDDDDPRVYPGAPEVPGNGIADGCAGDDLVPGTAEAIYVDSVGGSGAGDGSPTDPFATITQGLQESAARGGLPLFLATGTYAESVTTNVSIHGGRSASDWSLAGVSTVSAPLSGPGILVDSARAVTLSDLEVTTSSASSPAVRLSDASGTNAIRLDQVSAHGNGSFSVGLDVSTGGRVAVTGGSFSGTDFGVRLQKSAASYFEGLVVDNGVYIYGGQVTADTAIVRSRIARPDVALHYQDGWRDDHLTIVATVVYSTLDSGLDCDAAWIYGPNLTLVDSTLAGGGCSASQGLVFGSDYDLTVVNSITAATNTLSSYTSSRVTLSGTDLWTASGCLVSVVGEACVNGGAAAVDACDWVGCVAATATRSVDPLFVVPDGELRLQDTSPVIDKGTDPGAVVPASRTAFDIDGQARPLGEGRDIGADEVK